MADEFGYFTLPFVAQGKEFVIDAVGGGRLPSSTSRLVLLGDEMQGVVVPLLKRGHTVRGKLLDGTGAPVAGAMVSVRAMGENEECSAEQRRSRTFLSSTTKRLITGPDGPYEFRGIPSGTVTVVASKQGQRPVHRAAVVTSEPPVELNLSLP